MRLLLSRKTIAYVLIALGVIVVAAWIACGPAKASDCPCPPDKPKPVAVKKSSPPPVIPAVKIVDHAVQVPTPGPPGPPGPAGPPGAKGDPGPLTTLTEAKIASPSGDPRPLVGGGFGYHHDASYHLFTGAQFPSDSNGGNLQLQVGAFYVDGDGTPAVNGTCLVGCQTCRWTVPARDAPNPWGWTASLVYVFK
jgi:hypothetical protein